MATKRLQKEQKKTETELPPGCLAGPDGGDLFKWTASIQGPKGSPYEAGVFNLSFEFPSDFPFKPPKVQFTTKVYHPNVNDNGTICMDILKDAWKPATGVNDIMLALVSLLTEPNPDDALVPEIADLFKSNRAEFDKTAKAFTKKHAKA